MDLVVLDGSTPGVAHHLMVRRFGVQGVRPKIYIQAGLHADEVPPMLVAHHLHALLAAEDAAGRIVGEVVVLAAANPIGLSQQVLGTAIGRFDLGDGVNFNRAVPALTDAVAADVGSRLGFDAAVNVSLIRASLLAAAATWPAHTSAEHLKRHLLGLAMDADVVLDLHCENEGVVHLYALTPLEPACRPLAALLGAQAVLLADESGGDPFDEACSRPWLLLQQRFPQYPIPLFCCAVTVELRGEADVRHGLALDDAKAIVASMVVAGVISGDMPAMPAPRCQPSALAAVEPVTALTSGILVFHQALGATVAPGSLVATITDPVSGTASLLHAKSAGVLFARESARLVRAGRSVAKIAGTVQTRTGRLLGA